MTPRARSLIFAGSDLRSLLENELIRRELLDFSKEHVQRVEVGYCAAQGGDIVRADIVDHEQE